MNVEITFNDEELDAFTEFTIANNAESNEAMVQTIIQSQVTSLVLAKRAKTATEISNATENLPYDKRVELAALNREFIAGALTSP